MGGIRLNENDLRHIEVIKKKSIDVGETLKNNSQVIRKSLEFTSMYYPLNLSGG